MYDDFQKEVKPKTKVRYKEFLKQIEADSKIYIQILNPRREDYGNRKEYFWLVQSLNVLMNFFNIVQVRIALLALFKIKEKDLISTDKFKSTILFLENFHFAYNSITSGSANRFENIYSKFAIELNKSTNKDQVIKNIDENLINPINKLFPDFQLFSKSFAELTFTKKEHPNNIKSKYVIQKLNCFYEKVDVFSDLGTIEHIISEKEGIKSLNIGNLILLEEKLNNEAGDNVYLDKKKTYMKSSYKWVKDFVSSNENWEENNIEMRAKKLAEIYYKDILGKTI